MTNQIIVTGGAGFIGSNIVNELLKDNDTIHVFDNFSTGRLDNLPKDNNNIVIHKLDLKSNYHDWPKIKAKKIFHMAANADVRGGLHDQEKDFNENICVTKSICDYALLNSIDDVVFASSATVYGEPTIFPTPENTSLAQTSLYGASKLAGEALLQAYSSYGFFKSSIFRFVSWTGPGYSHGVIYDFVSKLLNNPNKLEILGNGKQTKSYLDVIDGVRGVIALSSSFEKDSKIYNLGHRETINVIDLADIVCQEMSLKNVLYQFTGGERGWIGDSPFVQLDTSLAEENGWFPSISIEESIRRTVRYLLEDRSRLFR